MDTHTPSNSTRQTAIYGLAVVGCITLVALGIWLAVYSVRYIPTLTSTIDRLGAAAVSLTQVFTPFSKSTLSVIPVGSTTIPFGTGTSTLSTTSTTPNTSTASTKINWTPGTPIAITNNETTSPSVPVTPHYSGLPNLAVKITTVGYKAADGNIIATTTIPANTQIAVKFKVTNIGTNVSGLWAMNIAIPSDGMLGQQSFTIESLAPTQPREFIASFGNITPGSNRTIVITVDPNHQLIESSIANNVATTSVTVLGS